MDKKTLYSMLPRELMSAINESKNSCISIEEIDMEFDNFISMTIETVSGNKTITSAVYREKNNKIEWKYKAFSFLLLVNGILVVKINSN
jgi:hypothetical protein